MEEEKSDPSVSLSVAVVCLLAVICPQLLGEAATYSRPSHVL